MQSPTNSRMQRQPVQDRISQLSNKITNMHLSKNDSTKKYQQIESMCDQIQSKLEEFGHFFEEKLIDIRHKTVKISKEVKKDHAGIDGLLRDEVSAANQRIMGVVDQELQAQKETNLRILKFIEHESNVLREQIDMEAHERDDEARLIQSSLANDIAQIETTLDQVCNNCQQKINQSEASLIARSEKLSEKLREISSTYSDNEAQFYKMLRDLVKKVKNQLHEHQERREETETQILNLIEKMCDKAIQEKKI